MNIEKFKVRGNKVKFTLGSQDFTVKYPEKYNFTREYHNLLKEIPLCMWANSLAFTKPKETSVPFEVPEYTEKFWLWIAQKVHEFDCYESGTQPEKIRPTIETQSEQRGLLQTPSLSQDGYAGAIISQSTGKESVASKIILDNMGIENESVFIEYPSRALTHKQDGKAEFDNYFGKSTRVWTNCNCLQSTLHEHTDNYIPVTIFWEMLYSVIELPMAAYDKFKYIIMGNEISAGERKEGKNYVTWEDFQQSAIYELALTSYIKCQHNLPIVHTSVVGPITSFGCRKVVLENEPEFYPKVQSCLRPTPDNRWCLKCYKCERAWIENVALGVNPEDVGLSNSCLIENPHLGADTDDWGYSTSKYDRDEYIWNEYVDLTEDNSIACQLTINESNHLKIWRKRQKERVESYDEYGKYVDKWSSPAERHLPSELVPDSIEGIDGKTDYIPDSYDVDGRRALEWIDV